jgi:YesN/AraC family two-component response regulator
MEERELFRIPQLTLDDLATALNSNRSYVSTNINKFCGCNFKQLLIHYRIDAAKKLLLNSELDIQSIAEQAGFNSRMSFYRAFNENVTTDLSPTEWRKQKKAN